MIVFDENCKIERVTSEIYGKYYVSVWNCSIDEAVKYADELGIDYVIYPHDLNADNSVKINDIVFKSKGNYIKAVKLNEFCCKLFHKYVELYR